MKNTLLAVAFVTALSGWPDCLDQLFEPEGRLWVQTQVAYYDDLHGEDIVPDPYRAISGDLLEAGPNPEWDGPTFIVRTNEVSKGYNDHRTLPGRWKFHFEDGPCEGQDTSSHYMYNNSLLRIRCSIYTGYDYSEETVEGVWATGFSSDGWWIPAPYDVGCCLYSDEELEFGGVLTSPNGRYTLVFQTDGNLVLIDTLEDEVLWASGTEETGAHHVYMQGDGNLVISNSFWSPLWASDTNGFAGARLELQNDGNLVIYSSTNVALWDIW